MFLFLTFFLLTGASAGEWSTPGGKIELRAGEFLTTTEEYPQSMGQAFLKLETSGTHENFGTKISPLLTVNTQDLSRPGKTSVHLLTSEVWGDFTSETVDFTVGLAPVKWGAADGINPTNGFRSYDLSDPVFPRELSQAQLALKIHPGADQDIVFEGVFVPDGQTDILPFSESEGRFDPTDSRWGTVLPSAVDVGQSVTVPLRYSLESEKHNPSSDFAGRLRFLQVNGWDYSLAAGQFRRKRAILNYRLTGDASIPSLPLTVRIKPHYPRQNMVGGDAAGTWGDFGVRAEVAKYFVKSSDRAFGYDSLIGNAGIDRLWENVFGENSFYMNASYVFIDNDKSDEFQKDSIDLAFTRSYGTLRTELRFEKWAPGAYFFITVDRNSVINLFLKHEWSESLQLGLTASFLNGEVNTGIGQLSDNHRLIGQLEYFF